MKTKILRIGFALFLTVSTFMVSAQEIEVHGTVYDASDRRPLIGTTVLIKGTHTGTITDIHGQYRIRVQKGKTLIFSFVGFLTKEVRVTGTRLDIYLEEDKRSLEEVTVVAFGKQKRQSLVGNMAYIQDRNIMTFQPPYIIRPNTEEYEAYKENRFLSASKHPLSTFSLDVDAASYGNIRRMINQGEMPGKDAVRIEEMINYFTYDYPQPGGEHPVNILTEATVCPWNKQHRLVRIGVKAKEIPSATLPPSNLVFLIDVSGSMYSQDKLPLVKSSMKLLVNNLRPEDRVAIVTYAGAAGEVLPATSGADKQKILDALENLQAGGSTAGGAGIQLAYKIAGKNFIKGGNNRVILCTDGDFNVGVSSTSELESLIESKRKSGVFLTVLGYGMGNYKDNKLQTLAEKGNGNHAYIDNLQEANKTLVNEFGSTMYAVAKDVKLQVEFNPAFVKAYRLVGYESRLLNEEDFNDDAKDAGELGAGHTVTALYEIVPAGVESSAGSVDPLKYQKQKNSSAALSLTGSKELLTVKLRYKNPDANRSKKLEIALPANQLNKNPSKDFHFAMAVAMFGQLLKDSDFKGDATYGKVIDLARKGLDEDRQGYRREFIRLVETVEQLEK